MYRTIVVATDGSAHADEAIRVAAQLAGGGARLILVHVLEHGTLSEDLRHLAEVEHLKDRMPGPDYHLAGVPSWMSDLVREGASAGTDHRILESIGTMVLDRATATAREAGATAIEPVTEHGDPARRILAVAQREQADLLVVGSRGLTDLTGLVLGSVSHRVAHQAPCTCLTVSGPVG